MAEPDRGWIGVARWRQVRRTIAGVLESAAALKTLRTAFDENENIHARPPGRKGAQSTESEGFRDTRDRLDRSFPYLSWRLRVLV
jgi:hypothetical protein